MSGVVPTVPNVPHKNKHVVPGVVPPHKPHYNAVQSMLTSPHGDELHRKPKNKAEEHKGQCHAGIFCPRGQHS